MTIRIVPRHEWGAVPPSSPLVPMPTPTSVVYIHHSATAGQGPEALQNFQHYHMSTKEMRDIAYNFLVGDNGTVYEGRGWGKAHGGNSGIDNRISHSICLMGNFQVSEPTEASIDSLVELLRLGKTSGCWLLKDIRGHRQERELSPDGGTITACPGNNLYSRLPEIRTRANAIYTHPIPTPVPEEDTMTIYDLKGQPSLLFTGGRFMRVSAAQSKFLREREGVVNKGVDQATYDVITSFPHITD